MFSLLQQTAPVVVETTETVVVDGAGHEQVIVQETVVHEGAGQVAHHAAESASGMPQLDPSHFPNQIFWLLVTLAIIYFVLSRVALPRIGGVLAQRDGSITGDLKAAEAYKQKAKDAEESYEKALAEARAEANKIVDANRAEMQKELDSAIARADADIAQRTAESERKIDAIRANSVENARDVAREVAASLVEALGGKVDEAAVRAAVDARLAKGGM